MLGVSSDTRHKTPDHGSSEAATPDARLPRLTDEVEGSVRPCFSTAAHGSAAGCGAIPGFSNFADSTSPQGSSLHQVMETMMGCALMWLGPLVTV